jgi:hypothetical protein
VRDENGNLLDTRHREDDENQTIDTGVNRGGLPTLKRLKEPRTALTSYW